MLHIQARKLKKGDDVTVKETGKTYQVKRPPTPEEKKQNWIQIETNGGTYYHQELV